MSNLSLILIAAGIVTAAAVLLSLNDLYEKRRRKRRQDFGRQNGFEPVSDRALQSAFRFPREILLYSADLPGFDNPLRKEYGDVVLLLVDYHYSEWVGDRTFRRDFTLCHFTSGDLALPAFQLQRESLGDKVAGVLGYQDIDLDHSPAFSKRFLLRGRDQASIHNLFTPAVTGPLAGMDDIRVEGHGDALVVTRSGGFVEESDLGGLLRQAETVFDLLRRHPLPAERSAQAVEAPAAHRSPKNF